MWMGAYVTFCLGVCLTGPSINALCTFVLAVGPAANIAGLGAAAWVEGLPEVLHQQHAPAAQLLLAVLHLQQTRCACDSDADGDCVSLSITSAPRC